MSNEALTTTKPVNPMKWLAVGGLVLQALIAALMLLAGSGKAFGFAPPEVVENLARHGLKDQMQLIGLGEVGSAILMLIPQTSPLGTLLTSGFWGGAICLHMSHGESYVFQSVLLLTTWLGAQLRGSVTVFK